VELNSNIARLHAAGVGIAAITPDSTAVLARFASEYAIGYPLLADVGGRVIEQFGVLNHNIVPNERQATGIPFPGHFLLDSDGRVLAKSFTGDLRHRASGSALVAAEFGVFDGPRVVAETGELRAALQVSTSRLFGGQEAAMLLDIDVAENWHIYAAGVDPPYQPVVLDLEADGNLLESYAFTWPTPTPIRFEALDITLPTHAGRVRVTGRFRLRWSPPPSIFDGLEDAVARRAISPGVYAINCTLRYQACDDNRCLPAREVHLAMPITVEPTALPSPVEPRVPEPEV
jgi:hypothetical protein